MALRPFLASILALAGCRALVGIEDLPLAAPDAGPADAAPPPPSCEGVVRTCGAGGDADCCESIAVPGGRFERSDLALALVSPFSLDRFEVTNERFRAFVRSGAALRDHPPAGGAGLHPGVPGSGWRSAWNQFLPATEDELVADLAPCAAHHPYTREAGPDDRHPVSCVDWFLAFAFCVWDGGRLPSEAEWNFVAAAGDQQRLYPWGDASGEGRAVFGCPSGDTTCPRPVGSFPLGDSLWGHADLGGNVAEWMHDGYDPSYPEPCTDCLAPWASKVVIRGGAYFSLVDKLQAGRRDAAVNSPGSKEVGIRCAR